MHLLLSHLHYLAFAELNLHSHFYNLVPTPAGKYARLKNIITENYRAYTLADIGLSINYNFSESSSTIFSNKTTLTTPLTQQYKNDSSGNPLKSCTSVGFQLVWGSQATTSSAPPAFSRIYLVFEYIDLPANT